MLSSRLPTALIARLLLALLLVCNLMFCVSWPAFSSASDPAASATLAEANLAEVKKELSTVASCHSAANMAAPDMSEASMATMQASGSQGDCQMHSGLTPSADITLLLLVTLLALPLLLLPRPPLALLDHWLRDPFLRLRGTHPPSWPRRHLMLSVLRH